MQIRPFHSADGAAVVQLWSQCGLTRAWNDPAKDIRRKAAVQPELFLVGVHQGEVVATVMAGYDGHRGWMNYLAVSPHQRGRGWGRQIVAAAEARLRHLGCPKVNLQVRLTNAGAVEFYRKLGYREDAVVSLGKRLESDEGGSGEPGAGEPGAGEPGAGESGAGESGAAEAK